MPTRRQLDRLLKGYLSADERHRVEHARRELRADYDSMPPPPELEEARQRMIERVGTDTGSYDLRALESQVRDVTEKMAASRIADEMDRRKIAEGKLAERESDSRKFWFTVLAGVLVGLLLGGITWAVTTLVGVHQQRSGSIKSSAIAPREPPLLLMARLAATSVILKDS